MTTYYNTIKLVLLFGLFLGVSCTSNDLDSNSTTLGQRAEIRANIGNPVETKATLRTDDGISYSGFVKDDKIGFYSTGGLTATNKELTYSTSSFLNYDLQWLDGPAKNIFAYYPYKAYTADAEDIDIWREEDPQTPLEAGFNDMLTASTTNIAQGTLVQLNFQHHFAMLIIQRGAGFQSPKPNEDIITVNLKEPVGKTATIKNRNTIELKKDETDGVKILTANKGQYNSKDSWYVIVPIGNFSGGGKAEVESITLYNDNGDEMTISYTRKNLASNTKYLVTVKLRDDVAVIEPEEIIRWTDEDVNIEVPPGISTEEDFSRWLAVYNDKTFDQSELGKYGSYDKDNSKWTFRLLNDINIKTWNQTPGNSVVITTFSDIFDGQGHTISGLKLIGTSSNIGFFGKLTSTGTVQNLKLEDINLKGVDNVGAIAGTNAGTIKNCHVKGFSIVVGEANVGGLVGENTGTITECTSSAMVSGTAPGLLVGSGTADKSNISTGVVVKK